MAYAMLIAIKHICPVCGYPDLPEPAYDGDLGSLEICFSCGFQFGVSDDDCGISHQRWRAHWISKGMPWNSLGIISQPKDWNPREQLRNAPAEPNAEPLNSWMGCLSHTCPICGYPDLPQHAYNEHGHPSEQTCPSCSYTFKEPEYSIASSHEGWRLLWMTQGMPWGSTASQPAPEGWNPKEQLGALLLAQAQHELHHA